MPFCCYTLHLLHVAAATHLMEYFCLCPGRPVRSLRVRGVVEGEEEELMN